jgi:hypothetical protein
MCVLVLAVLSPVVEAPLGELAPQPFLILSPLDGAALGFEFGDGPCPASGRGRRQDGLGHDREDPAAVDGAAQLIIDDEVAIG